MRVTRTSGAVLAAALLCATAAVVTVGGGSTSASAGAFTPLPAPARLLDTRPGETTIDGQFAGGGILDAGSTLHVKVAGRAGIPDDATAVVMNLTATASEGFGFGTVFPCEVATPNASNVNYSPGQTIPNAAVVKIGTTGEVCLFTLARSHFIIDVAGYFPDGTYVPLATPTRLLDTRPGQTTDDGQFAGQGIRPAGSTLTLDIAGRAGIPADAAAVVMNVTVTEPAAGGFATMFPCETGQPTASNLNYSAGQTIPNLVVAKIGSGGQVCLFTLAAAHYIVDVAGYFPAGTFDPLNAPARILDTRVGQTTADGQFQGIGTRAAQSSLRLDVAERVGIPANASAVVLNVTVANPQSAGFATVFPRGVSRPNASNLNYAAGQVIPNAVIAKIGIGGDVCVFTLAPADYIIDVTGFIIGTAPPASGTDCPATPAPPTTTTTTTTTTTMPPANCDAAYPTVCIPPPPPDLDCGEIVHRNFVVLPPDPHNFDTDNDGVGCESA